MLPRQTYPAGTASVRWLLGGFVEPQPNLTDPDMPSGRHLLLGLGRESLDRAMGDAGKGWSGVIMQRFRMISNPSDRLSTPTTFSRLDDGENYSLGC
jgi:hypothetical protein